MNTILNNFINGNLRDAKRQAKRHSLPALYAFLVDEQEYDPAQAQRLALYLKGKGPFPA